MCEIFLQNRGSFTVYSDVQVARHCEVPMNARFCINWSLWRFGREGENIGDNQYMIKL